MVEKVEEFGPKTQPHLFGEAKLALQPNIRLRRSETAEHIAPEIALLPRRRRGKRSRIERLASRILRPIEHKRHSGHYVWTRVQVDAFGNDNSAKHVHRRSRPRKNEAIHRPTAQRGAGNIVVP